MSTVKHKVLFVQHAGLGGAAVSLSQIIRQLDHNKFIPSVLLLQNDLKAIDLLQNCGSEAIVNNKLFTKWQTKF